MSPRNAAAGRLLRPARNTPPSWYRPTAVSRPRGSFTGVPIISNGPARSWRDRAATVRATHASMPSAGGRDGPAAPLGGALAGPGGDAAEPRPTCAAAGPRGAAEDWSRFATAHPVT